MRFLDAFASDLSGDCLRHIPIHQLDNDLNINRRNPAGWMSSKTFRPMALSFMASGCGFIPPAIITHR